MDEIEEFYQILISDLLIEFLIYVNLHNLIFLSFLELLI